MRGQVQARYLQSFLLVHLKLKLCEFLVLLTERVQGRLIERMLGDLAENGTGQGIEDRVVPVVPDLRREKGTTMLDAF